MTALNDPGMVRILDTLEQGIAEVHVDVNRLEDKIDTYTRQSITKQEFNAYVDLRRTTVRWAVGTIVSVMTLLATAVTIIVMTRPFVG